MNDARGLQLGAGTWAADPPPPGRDPAAAGGGAGVPSAASQRVPACQPSQGVSTWDLSCVTSLRAVCPLEEGASVDPQAGLSSRGPRNRFSNRVPPSTQGPGEGSGEGRVGTLYLPHMWGLPTQRGPLRVPEAANTFLRYPSSPSTAGSQPSEARAGGSVRGYSGVPSSGSGARTLGALV